jgi:ABC-type lipoprotein export system ATPase subunit
VSKQVRLEQGQSGAPKSALSSEEAYSFASFWRCALQVNPFKYQETYRGQDHGHDEDGYNQALLKKCLELGIKVVGIADHGSVESVDKLRETLKGGDVVVFPGFEIASTETIHMVCLFHEDTSTAKLNRYLGELGLADAIDGRRPSKYGCLELAKKIHDLGGFWYAAHATNSNGLIRLDKGDGRLVHVWKDSQCVRVVHIPGPVAGLPKNSRDIVENKNPDYKRERPITVIRAKDVAKPEDLAEPSASCWIKMTRPSFEAFKIAFLDPESRIRLALDEEPHGVLESMTIHGGYLDGVEARFSNHLNALIGGRGTGKSTLLECLRYVLELSPKGKQALKVHQDMLKENLGKQAGAIELVVRSAAQHGARFTISRRYGEPPIVRDASGAVSQQAPRDLLPQIEIYGQNEIFELAQDAQSRARLLERFLPAETTASEQREALRKKLADNAQKLINARTELDEVSEKVARLPKLGEQLKGFQDLGIEDKLAKTPLYARERQLVERVQQELARLESGVQTLGESLPDLTFLSDKALEGLPDISALIGLRAALEQLREDFAKHQSAMQARLESSKLALEPQVTAWQTAMKAGEQELEKALAGLPDMAGKSGREVGAAYRQLTQEIERIRPLEAKKSTRAQLLATLEQDRRTLLAELSDVRRARASKLQAAVTTLNQRLKGKLRVELRVEGDRSGLKDFLAGCRLDGVGEKRLAWLEEKEVTPLALARAIREGATKLAADYGVTPVVAEALTKLSYANLLELEGLELTDHVRIELNVAHGDAEHYKDLSRLSTGQQCTAVLHLLLLENSDPLVVDQPEDNLDNAFIAERIVRELRDAKTRRQFLFSTHNANIPVFGDAEWIGVLTASESRGALEPGHQGSIDVPYIREQAAEILEGGRAAFTQRQEMYEF